MGRHKKESLVVSGESVNAPMPALTAAQIAWIVSTEKAKVAVENAAKNEALAAARLETARKEPSRSVRVGFNGRLVFGGVVGEGADAEIASTKTPVLDGNFTIELPDRRVVELPLAAKAGERVRHKAARALMERFMAAFGAGYGGDATAGILPVAVKIAPDAPTDAPTAETDDDDDDDEPEEIGA